MSDVFVVATATANDISKLPPEFGRAERFDGIFYIDLPSAPEREAIWPIYLCKYGLPAITPVRAPPTRDGRARRFNRAAAWRRS